MRNSRDNTEMRDGRSGRKKRDGRKKRNQDGIPRRACRKAREIKYGNNRDNSNRRKMKDGRNIRERREGRFWREMREGRKRSEGD